MRIHRHCLAVVVVLITSSVLSMAQAASSAGDTGPSTASGPALLQIDSGHIVARVSPIFAGLMTEEINHSYDGGLYAELIRDRTLADPLIPQANAIGPWVFVSDGPAKGGMSLDVSDPLSQAISASVRIEATNASPRGRVGVANNGYWGIPVRPSTRYRASFYAKTIASSIAPLTVSIESDNGKVQYAHASVKVTGPDWKRYEAVLTTAAAATPTEKARFVISTDHPGTFWVTLISLFPPTWNNRRNGNRIDLMQDLADLHPKFLRLPGGNYLEGDTIATRFDWKKTIGDLRSRAGHQGPWGYPSSDGLGYLEFLEWSEDLRMEPVLGVYAGFSFQEPAVKAGVNLEPYVQDALDEIEYTMGGPQTKWGAVRARDGHPAPFKLTYVEVGNEDGGSAYESRFAQFYDAIKQQYPQLQIIATSPVTSRTPDVLDEHFYPSYSGNGAFLGDVKHYDLYDRKGPKILVGEWATVGGSPTPTMKDAIGDAAWMIGMERNSDIVIMQAYAPLLANVNRDGYEWKTNLIGYDALTSFGSPSYYAQKMFNANRGDVVLQSTLSPAPGLFTSATRDTRTGTIYLKAVNSTPAPIEVQIALQGPPPEASGRQVVLTSPDLDAVNSVENPTKAAPVETTLADVKPTFDHQFPPNSISVLVLKTPVTESDRNALAEEQTAAGKTAAPTSKSADRDTPENYGSEMSYQALLEEYRAGQRDPNVLLSLVIRAQKEHDQDTADKIMAEINHLIDKEYLLPKGITPQFTSVSKTEPDWVALTEAISQKFGPHYAECSVLGGKQTWFTANALAERSIAHPNDANYPPDAAEQKLRDQEYSAGFALLDKCADEKPNPNDIAWDIFLFSNDKANLERAAEVMRKDAAEDPTNDQHLDTYANLLYKLGKRDEALQAEEKALKLARENHSPYLHWTQENYDNMLNGKPNWLSK